MARFTRAIRQQIVREFAEKNGGWFDPARFLSHVEKQGEKHPAWEWFEWDDDNAANEFRIDQARDFARGLVIRFEVQSLHRGKFKVTEHTVPLAVSPVSGRRGGGGYYITDPNDPAHMAELCYQAAQSLRWFLSRYEGALRYSGVDIAPLEKTRSVLEGMTEQAEAA